MSRLLGAAPWVRQPQVPVGISRANPLARNLVFAHNGATVLDHARGVRPTAFPSGLTGWATSAPLVDGAAGTEKGGFVGPQHMGASGVGRALNYQNFPAIGSSVTLFARAYVDSNFGDGGFIFSFGDEVNNVGIEVGIGATNIEVWIANTTGNWVDTVGPAYASDDIIDIAVVIAAGSPAKIYTSLSNTVYNSAANYSNVNAAGSAMCIGSYSTGGGLALLGIVGCALAWERALSEREVREVMCNPWQVFAPLRRVVPPPRAGAAPPILYGTAGQWHKTLLLDGWYGEYAGIKGWYAVDFLTPAAAGGMVLKAWNGSAWVAGTLKRWSGSSWVAATLKRWNGSSWV